MDWCMKYSVRALVLLLVMSVRIYASGISYEEVTLVEVVTNSTFIVQAKYWGEDQDEYGPHSKYSVEAVLHSIEKTTNINLKVWAAHADVWGMALQFAGETGESNWFMVPAYKGKGRANKPEQGKSYILLLKQLARETDFAFYAEGALLKPEMLGEITLLARKNTKTEQPPPSIELKNDQAAGAGTSKDIPGQRAQGMMSEEEALRILDNVDPYSKEAMQALVYHHQLKQEAEHTLRIDQYKRCPLLNPSMCETNSVINSTGKATGNSATKSRIVAVIKGDPNLRHHICEVLYAHNIRAGFCGSMSCSIDVPDNVRKRAKVILKKDSGIHGYEIEIKTD